MTMTDWLWFSAWVGTIIYAQFHCDDHSRNWSCTPICYGTPKSVKLPMLGYVRIGGRNVVTGPGVPMRQPKAWERKSGGGNSADARRGSGQD